MTEKHTNSLINESSPYLLQHAHNPVGWLPWGTEALEKAKKEDKPIIVSIGYAACHWCHVMEHESFENEDIAAIMNEHFICIKVDREERPDVDQIYMDAVQAMGQQGGWPLNVFLTSEAKPFYGGTYFPPAHWAKICQNIAQAYDQQREKLEEAADNITNGISASILDRFTPSNDTTFNKQTLDLAVRELEKSFDTRHGGFSGAPKFPMPCNLSFLLHYYHMSKDETALNMVTKTLDEMAFGGIYDQVGGGFARYSTDAKWFAPHFEKMLYDNGQLLAVYAQAYRITKNDLYKDIVYETTAFCERELLSNAGGFFSSLDADSEGEEGKFYCWHEDELKTLLEDDFPLFKAYYHTTPNGNWEEKNILYLTQPMEALAAQHDISESELRLKIDKWKQMLLHERASRVRPGLDDKILASWNGLMLHGLCEAYRAFADDYFLQLAVKNAEFIDEFMMKDRRLYHNHKNGNTTLPGYLEDYAAVIKGFTALYQVTFDEKWLLKARTLTDYANTHFYDESEGLFYFTDDTGEQLIARKKELFDNVIPASNSLMAENLYMMGLYFDHDEYLEMSDRLVQNASGVIKSSVRYATQWAMVYAFKCQPRTEIVILGTNWDKKRVLLQQHEMGNAVFLGGEQASDQLPLLSGKSAEHDAMIYVCHNKTCRMPVKEVEKVIEQLEH